MRIFHCQCGKPITVHGRDDDPDHKVKCQGCRLVFNPRRKAKEPAGLSRGNPAARKKKAGSDRPLFEEKDR